MIPVALAIAAFGATAHYSARRDRSKDDGGNDIAYMWYIPIVVFIIFYQLVISGGE